ncbi:hypothetical protein [Nocardiopsis dassonvillei]|uniref:hypothetical protein n=1 Tax=Nocardiopsis dassonvillei TaxID=2014 RepID=UPI00363020F0
MKTVRMKHKKHGGVYNAPRQAVAFWKQRGWEVLNDGATTTVARTGKPVQQQQAAAELPAPEETSGDAPTDTPAPRRTSKKASEQ